MGRRHHRGRALPGDSTPTLKRQLPTLQAMLRQARQSPPPCLLCGEAVGAGATVHTFTPQDKAAWGIPEGVLASRVYTLCPTCAALEEVEASVLTHIWGEWQQERARASRWQAQLRARAASPWN
jgi:hypothetical protein